MIEPIGADKKRWRCIVHGLIDMHDVQNVTYHTPTSGAARVHWFCNRCYFEWHVRSLPSLIDVKEK